MKMPPKYHDRGGREKKSRFVQNIPVFAPPLFFGRAIYFLYKGQVLGFYETKQKKYTVDAIFTIYNENKKL